MLHMSDHSMPQLIAIVGPTAVGKSALAIRLAEAVGGEIVSADSRQVYRLMDIGTDKPPPEVRRRVPHHMIDLVWPDEPFTLAQYQEGAYTAIEDIHRRGRVPILAGGTPLYINAVLEGWTIPRVAPNPDLRRRLEQEAAELGPRSLFERLRELDPRAAERILPTNTRRIVRALEVIYSTGRPISEQQGKRPPPYHVLVIGLTCDRDILYRRIDARVDDQIRRGLIDEVAGLLARGYSEHLPSMTGLGYRQIVDYLKGRATLEEAVQRLKWDTHNFARHQGNWFRRMQNVHWIDTTQNDPTEEALRLIRG
jgi:tRNA dimethylallyltransferase